MSDSKTKVSISVSDGVGILSVLDGQLNTVDTGFGFLQTELAPGIYKVVCRLDRETHQQFFNLPQNQIVEINFNALDSVNSDHEFAEGIRVAYSDSNSTINIGTELGNSTLLIGCSGFQNNLPDLSLWSASNDLLTELNQVKWCKDLTSKIHFVRITLDSGNYIIKAASKIDFTVSRSIVLPEGGGSLFINCSGENLDVVKNLANATYYPNFQPRDNWPKVWFKLNILVSESLKKQRNLSRKNERILMLDEKYENPMLGLFVANLMLLDNPPNIVLLKTVIGNLQRYLGTENHPDLVALKLRVNGLLQENETRFTIYPVEFPPLLHISWRTLVEEAHTNPEIFATNSICWEIMDRVIDTDLWLMWRSIIIKTPKQRNQNDFVKVVGNLFPKIDDFAQFVGLADEFGLSPENGLFSEYHSHILSETAGRFVWKNKTSLPQLISDIDDSEDSQNEGPNFTRGFVGELRPPSGHGKVAENSVLKKYGLEKWDKTLTKLIRKVPWGKFIDIASDAVEAHELQITPLQEKIIASLAQLNLVLNTSDEIPQDYWQYLRKELTITEPYLVDSVFDLVTKAEWLINSEQEINK